MTARSALGVRMDAVEALVLKHQDYTRALAREISRRLPDHVDFEELVSWGQVGLVEAARSYDPSRTVAFTTFAYYRIRGAIFDGVRKSTWLPPAMRGEMNRQSAENEALEPIGGADDTDDAEVLAKRFTDAVARLGVVSLLSSADEGDRAIEPVQEDDVTAPLEQAEAAARMRESLAALPEEKRQILTMHFFEGLSVTDCAKRLGKNKSTISRRLVGAIDELRTVMLAHAPP